ncbi:hypothetical protein DFH06DRAFT_1480311 [Mycena polygramma]|nr:hypothetical protein DFH06DRAFT_1480311 [Mycena polygramma]
MILEADRARVAELQTQILHLECTLSQLRNAQLQVQQRLDSYKYPVVTLPSEIVSEILVRVLPAYPNFPQLAGPLSPTPLTQICRRWRDIAIGTPALWSAISSRHNNRDGRELRMFELWLQRSRHFPLSIALGTIDFRASNELIEAVIPHRARWRYLKIKLEEKNLPMLDGAMPSLQHLNLKTVSSPLLGPIPVHGVPRLRTATLNQAAAVHIILPWTQLTSLTLLAVRPSDFVPILLQTVNLVHCELDMDFGDSNDLEFRRDITLNCLESLVIKDFRGTSRTFILIFVVPSLRSLNVSESILRDAETRSAFGLKSGSGLEELHIADAEWLPEASYRQVFPSLRKFSMTPLSG